ncbi:MAG: HD domain-containing protein [Clostridia bacterium]|nr:HD domain-containing protein [Clostridia bacterium]
MLRIVLPDYVENIINAVQAGGYEAYVVGGCVRDMLMGRTPDDWDVTTNAEPQRLMALLPEHRIIETGLRHGTVTVLNGGNAVEVTTYRADGQYSDGRHPDEVRFGVSLEEDLKRRDFTVNAMAYCPGAGLIDLFGGAEDLRAGVLRAVGEPQARFGEDALRILRALRFSAALSFEIEAETAAAMHARREDLKKISRERIGAEWLKLICGENAGSVLMEHAEVLAAAMPCIAPSIGFDQRNSHHIYTVWEHTVRSMEAIAPEPLLRAVMFFHDLGKPQSFTVDADGVGHFYGHGAISERIAEETLTAFGLEKQFVRRVCTLVKYHDSDVFCSEKSVLRWLNKIGEKNFAALLKVKRADNLAQSEKYHGRQREIDALEALLRKVLAEKRCFSLRELAVDGDDMQRLGYSGREIGDVLERLLEEVIGGAENERESLLKRASALQRRGEENTNEKAD